MMALAGSFFLTFSANGVFPAIIKAGPANSPFTQDTKAVFYLSPFWRKTLRGMPQTGQT